MHAFKRLSHGLLHLLYPRLCEGCRIPLLPAEVIVCLSCEASIAKTNYHHIPDNATALRLAGRVPFLYATSLAYFTHESLVQHLVHRLKYYGRRDNGLFLGKELGRAIQEQAWDIDLIIPVPLHKKKEGMRGFNQSTVIADGISAVLNVPVITNAVIRSRFTETQTDKNRQQRMENVADAFKVIKPELLVGRHVLLTDDVMTTGATIESCAMAVLEVPEVRLSIATLGITYA